MHTEGRRKSSIAENIIKRFSFPGPELNPAFEFDDHGTAPTGYKNQPPARLCHLTKYSSEPNFGFIVRTYSDNGEKVVLQLDEDGVAARSGK